MDREKIIKYCNKIIEISLYVMAFYIPISRAIIESFVSLAIVAWLIKKFASKARPREIFCSTFLNLPIFIYLLILFASAIHSTNPAISFRHIIFKTIEYLLLFFVTVEILDRRILKNILVVLVFSVTLVGIDGIYQYFTKHDFLRNREMAIPEIRKRIHGPFMMPTDFGNYIVTLLPLVTGISFIKFKNKWLKLTLIAISLLLFICLVLSVSRSAWLALFLATFFALVLGNRRFFIFSILLITIVLVSFPLLSYVAKNRIIHFFEFNEGGGFSQRHFLWKMGLNMFEERPILGQGLGTFMYNFERFKPKDYPAGWEISYAHNCFLQIASETGILGFLSFITMITILFFVSIKILIGIKKNVFYYHILSGLLIGIFAYLVGSTFDTNLYSLPLAVLFWFFVGLTAGVIKIIRLESRQ